MQNYRVLETEEEAVRASWEARNAFQGMLKKRGEKIDPMTVAKWWPLATVENAQKFVIQDA